MDSKSDARTYFPRGLQQPEKGFRFSMDALLLAAFAAQKPYVQALDLGAGCGVVGLGLVLLQQGRVKGVDILQDMVDAATDNSRLLGLQQNCEYACMDLRERDINWREFAPPGSFDLVLANPPYRHQASGRVNPEQGRSEARFELHADLQDFAAAARAACATRARFCLIYLAERLQLACTVLDEAGFALKRLLPVHSRSEEPARLVLLEARKQGGAGLVLEPPLVLYQGAGEATQLTSQALAFCPFLACNAAGRSPDDDEKKSLSPNENPGGVP